MAADYGARWPQTIKNKEVTGIFSNRAAFAALPYASIVPETNPVSRSIKADGLYDYVDDLGTRPFVMLFKIQ